MSVNELDCRISEICDSTQLHFPEEFGIEIVIIFFYLFIFSVTEKVVLNNWINCLYYDFSL